MVTTEKATEVLQGPYEIEGGFVHLRAGRCPECGAVFCPARVVCDGCGHRGLDEILLAPRGTTYTFTTVHQSTPDFRTPYHLAYVDFDEHVRVMLPTAGEETPRIGAAVEIVLGPGPRVVDGEPEVGPHALMVGAPATERSDGNG